LLRDGAREQGVQAERPLHLSRLYVDRPFLGAKVGAALMLRCLEEGLARRHDVLWLGVWERNARARAFYSRWGFTEVGEMHFLLGSDLQRDIVLARAL
ncbi:GNAT family N-acetyltransferase, partial [Stigmatella erecta]